MPNLSQYIEQVETTGWVLIDNFLAPNQLSKALEYLYQIYPTLDTYESSPNKFQWLQEDPFAGLIPFPFSVPFLNKLPFLADLLDITEAFLQTDAFILHKANIQAKYAGAANYNQPLHFDHPNHTLVVPDGRPAYRQLGFFLYFSDVTEETGPTHFVPKEHTRDLPIGYTHFFEEPEPAQSRHFFKAAPELYKHEQPAVGPAGSLLVYDLNTLHRGANLTGASAMRLTLSLAYGHPHRWQGFQSWPRLAEEKALMDFITTATPRERELIGFPRVGDPYWTAQTCTLVEARYPGIDLSPYLSAIQ